MFKKLLTLAAVAALCTSAQAKEVVDAYVDFSTQTELKLYAWGGSESARARISLEDGMFHFHSDEATDPAWDVQFFPIGGVEVTPGVVYTLTMEIKGTVEAGINCHFGGVDKWGGLPITLDWKEVAIEYETTGDSGDVLIQCGDYVGDWWVKWMKITHEEKDDAKPVEWDSWLENGDAEGEYGEVACAWGKAYAGRSGEDGKDEIAQPAPCEIITEDGNQVFIVRAKAVDPEEWPKQFKNEDGTVGGAPEWQNQFWIMAPKTFPVGESIKVSFRYKASKPATIGTQFHHGAGAYLHWMAIGDVNFTTDWQTFEREFTVPSETKDEMQSIAFNLGANKAYESDIDFYFDDLKWETMKLDEGYFVADQREDYDNAIEMLYDDDKEMYVAVVGKDVAAEKIKISTRRGNDKAFAKNLLKVLDGAELAVDALEEDETYSFTTGGSKWLTLPEAGVWTIYLDTEYEQIYIEAGDTSGVADVAVENVAPVYYNLQGVKVLNPANGNIYIVKRGNKVSKEIVR